MNPPGSAEQFTPLLATSWEHSKDGLTWTWHLREGVTFHDGEPFNADAAVQSIMASKDRGGAGFIWAPLKSVKATDGNTIVMHLSYAAPMDLVAGSTYGSWMVAPKALAAEKKNGKYFEKGIAAGTGPYTLSSYTPNQEVVFEKNPSYWGGWDGAHFDKVLLEITPEAVQQQQMLDGGQVDLALRLPQDSLASYKDKPGFTLSVNASWLNFTAFFNTLRPPLDNPLVRQALSYAIPYQDIVDVGQLGFATQARGPVPQGVYPYSDSTPQYQEDLTKAKDLLTKAGYPNGGFTLNLTYAAENDSEGRFAPLFKSAFAKIGVTVNVKAILFNQQWEQAKSDPKNAQDIFVLLYWPTYADAGTDNLYSMFHCADPPFFNLSYWCNKTFDKDIDTAAKLEVTDPQKAQSLYDDAQKLLVDQAPAGFLMDSQAVYAVPDTITGFQYNENYPFSLFFYGMSRTA